MTPVQNQKTVFRSLSRLQENVLRKRKNWKWIKKKSDYPKFPYTKNLTSNNPCQKTENRPNQPYYQNTNGITMRQTTSSQQLYATETKENEPEIEW